MRYAVGADHAGYVLKDVIAAHLRERGAEILDLGTSSSGSVDYPDFAAAVGRAILSGAADRGILVCGTGLGMVMAANKLPGIRAAIATEPFSARMAVEHNDAQILCLGARVVGEGLAKTIVDAYDGARFEGGRHQRRIDKIHALEGDEPSP